MSMTYKIVEIFTSEAARWHGSPLYEAVIHMLTHEKTGARCIVTHGVAGCFENGEIASHHILDISYNMPVKIEIVLAEAQLDRVLPKLQEMVKDGFMAIR